MSLAKRIQQLESEKSKYKTKQPKLKTLALDLELSPNVAHVWGLWNNNVSLAQLQESQEVICFGAKWVDGKKVFFKSVHHHGKKEMLDELWHLINEADAILGWNSKNFDMKHANREFLENGYPPPSPVKHLDLMHVARSQFKAPSNKLDYYSNLLLGHGKVPHEGHSLWVKCMAGDKKAWAKMKEYQIEDVELLIPLYQTLLPWIPKHPNLGLYGGNGLCPKCDSVNIKQDGFETTGVSKFERFHCLECGSWFRGKYIVQGTDYRY
jgi:DNA polymerase elongation subunit (family B)